MEHGNKTTGLFIMKTNAENQKKYKENQINKGSKRLDTYIDAENSKQLEYLAKEMGLSKRAIIEILISAEFTRIKGYNLAKTKKL